MYICVEMPVIADISVRGVLSDHPMARVVITNLAPVGVKEGWHPRIGQYDLDNQIAAYVSVEIRSSPPNLG